MKKQKNIIFCKKISDRDIIKKVDLEIKKTKKDVDKLEEEIIEINSRIRLLL